MMKFRIKDIVHIWYVPEEMASINKYLQAGYIMSETYPKTEAEYSGLAVCLTLYDYLTDEQWKYELNKMN